jgi:hypothetical protein
MNNGTATRGDFNSQRDNLPAALPGVNPQLVANPQLTSPLLGGAGGSSGGTGVDTST